MAIIKEKRITVSSVIENLSPSGLAEGDAERTESSADGFFKISEGEYSLSFAEMTEGGRLVSDITVKDGAVSVSRRGAITSDMFFCEGESHSSLYSVPPYEFDVVIYTKKIRCNMTRDGGRVDIYYTMKIGGADKNVKMRIECV